ncbi:unnamed protein product [Rotaria socialis]|uniref:Uncharacterized protein n=1 Tax=Rotaria socialis TaxID=392032 RepID=A0A820Y5P5_9BILA|nr:unnamed protein product [Rotaria socialis]
MISTVHHLDSSPLPSQEHSVTVDRNLNEQPLTHGEPAPKTPFQNEVHHEELKANASEKVVSAPNHFLSLTPTPAPEKPGRNPTPNFTDNTRKCSKPSIIIFGAIIAVFVAATMAISIYLLVRQITAASTTTTTGQCNLTFGAPTTYSTSNTPRSIVAADVNADGSVDIIVANNGGNNVGVFINSGTGAFSIQMTYSTGASSNPNSVTTADINADGEIDIIVANNNANNVGVLINNGNGIFAAQVTYSSGNGPNCVVVVDVNGDGKVDIIVANYNANNVGVLINAGNGTFIAQVTYSTGGGSNPAFLAAADVNGDGKIDITVANYGASNVGVLINNGNGTFAAQVTYSTGGSSNPNCVVAADVNKDGKVDIIVANNGLNNVGVLLNVGGIAFTPQATYSTGSASGPNSIVVIDLNGDGKVDIAASNNAAGSFSVFLGTGSGTFLASTTYSIGSSISCVAAADVNSNGKTDIIVTLSNGNNIAVLLNSCNS